MKNFVRVFVLFVTAGIFFFSSCQQLSSDTSTSDSSASNTDASSASSTTTGLSAPSNFLADAVASSSFDVKLSWTAVSDATSYNLYASSDGSSFSALKTGITGTSYEDTDSSITADTLRYYKVSAVNAAGEGTVSSAIYVTFIAGTASSPTWLILYYADGDVYGNNYLWYSEQGYCHGLSDISDTLTYDSVKVVTLWDGSAQATDVSTSDSGKSAPTVSSKWSGSYLWELQAGTPEYNTDSISCTDYSSTASWLINSSGSQEVNMASNKTLTRFLVWAQGRYNPTHTIVVVGDHGGGPYASPSSSARAVCSDYTSTSDESVIYSEQIRTAFSNAGYGTNNRLALIWMDVCLESSVEEAYEVKDFAQYYLASENSEQMDVLKYDADCFLKQFTKNVTIETVVKNYTSAMSAIIANNITTHWADSLTYIKNQGITTVGGVTVSASNCTYLPEFYLVIAHTLTCVNLEKIDALASAVDTFASAITSDTTTAQKKAIASNYLKSTSPLGNTLAYLGSIYYLYDAGYFAYQVQQYATTAGLSSVSTAAGSVLSALTDAIVVSWRDAYRTSGRTTGLYFHGGTDSSADYGSGAFANNWFGLSLAGGYYDSNWLYGYKVSATNTNNSDVYTSVYYANLDFAADHPSWTTMCKAVLSAN